MNFVKRLCFVMLGVFVGVIFFALLAAILGLDFESNTIGDEQTTAFLIWLVVFIVYVILGYRAVPHTIPRIFGWEDVKIGFLQRVRLGSATGCIIIPMWLLKSNKNKEA